MGGEKQTVPFFATDEQPNNSTVFRKLPMAKLRAVLADNCVAKLSC
jgi:hypothetical protein